MLSYIRTRKSNIVNLNLTYIRKSRKRRNIQIEQVSSIAGDSRIT